MGEKERDNYTHRQIRETTHWIRGESMDHIKSNKENDRIRSRQQPKNQKRR